MMKKKIITISREFGSGGRTIGKELAEKLGWDFYDKEIIKRVSVESGLDEKYVEEHGEHATGGTFLGYAMAARNANGMSVDDILWLVQRKIVLDLAEGKPCVIVGRCADYILKDRADCLHILIYSDIEKRAHRIVHMYGESEKSPEKRLIDKDKKRKTNYKYYTGREWGQPQNFDICLNSGTLGIDGCVEAILNLVKD